MATKSSFICTLLGRKTSIGRISGAVYIKSPAQGTIAVHRSSVQAHQSEDTLSVMFWNVENFFDWRNDSTTVSDLEFSPAGERHWIWKRFQAKANAFAKALFWVEEETGRLPDIVGLEEVENAFVLRQVLQKTALRKTDYKYVHYDSPDRRGIDVALLYRSSVLELLDSKPCHLYAADTVMATRDILLCIFRRKIPGAEIAYPGLTGNLPLERKIPGQAGIGNLGAGNLTAKYTQEDIPRGHYGICRIKMTRFGIKELQDGGPI